MHSAQHQIIYLSNINIIKHALIEFAIILRNATHLEPICGWLASPPLYL